MIEVSGLTVAYGDTVVLADVDVQLTAGAVTTVLGPNGCGKSTLFGALVGLIRPRSGRITFDGDDAAAIPRRTLARRLALVHQRHQAPTDLTVAELIAHGRVPHRPWYRQATEDDRQIVEWAIDVAGLQAFRDRTVASLSGGEAQRAWIALALAQRPDVLLLDEPTTYLDIAHQLEVLELVTRINRTEGLTVGMVLHDLNHASAFSEHLVVLADGVVRAAGSPGEVLTDDLIAEVYGVQAEIDRRDPGHPRIHPIRRLTLSETDFWAGPLTPAS